LPEAFSKDTEQAPDTEKARKNQLSFSGLTDAKHGHQEASCSPSVSLNEKCMVAKDSGGSIECAEAQSLSAVAGGGGNASGTWLRAAVKAAVAGGGGKANNQQTVGAGMRLQHQATVKSPGQNPQLTNPEAVAAPSLRVGLQPKDPRCIPVEGKGELPQKRSFSKLVAGSSADGAGDPSVEAILADMAEAKEDVKRFKYEAERLGEELAAVRLEHQQQVKHGTDMPINNINVNN
jgi:hypothetical protein